MSTGQHKTPTASETSLEDWLSFLFSGETDELTITYMFPTPGMLHQYLAGISKRSEDEVKGLLKRFLIPTGSLGADARMFADMVHAMKSDRPRFDMMIKREFCRRLLSWGAAEKRRKRDPRAGGNPWEGITWVLDLVPDHPREALQAVHAYILAHMQALPDGRWTGLDDAGTLIRAKFIGLPGDSMVEQVTFLKSQEPRSLECVVERLYDAMGYQTVLTKPQADGGRDVIAKKKAAGSKELLQIECKRHNAPVGPSWVRALLGVVSDEKATKGVLVALTGFTRGARALAKRNSRLELIDGASLVRLLNEHLGRQWVEQVDRLVSKAERRSLRFGTALRPLS